MQIYPGFRNTAGIGLALVSTSKIFWLSWFSVVIFSVNHQHFAVIVIHLFWLERFFLYEHQEQVEWLKQWRDTNGAMQDNMQVLQSDEQWHFIIQWDRKMWWISWPPGPSLTGWSPLGCCLITLACRRPKSPGVRICCDGLPITHSEVKWMSLQTVQSL